MLTSLPMIPEREAEVRKRVVAKLRKLGCEVLCYSENRASRNTKGAPDTLIVPPRNLRAWLWEAKKEGGKASADQLAMQKRIEANGTRYIIGGEAEVDAHLREIGLLT